MAKKLSNLPPHPYHPPPPPPHHHHHHHPPPDYHLDHQGGEGVLCQDRRCSLGTKPDGTGHCKEINECFVEGWVYSQVHLHISLLLSLSGNTISWIYVGRVRFMRSTYIMIKSTMHLKRTQLCCQCKSHTFSNQPLTKMFFKG